MKAALVAGEWMTHANHGSEERLGLQSLAHQIWIVGLRDEIGMHGTLSSIILASTLWLVLAGTAAADSFGRGANRFDIDFVKIGQPGNEADLNGTPSPAGAVGYAYRIGRFETSREIVEKANLEGELGITLDPMEFVLGGVRPAMPATGVSWNEAARFANWLNTSQGFPVAYKFASQPGEPGYDVNENLALWTENDVGFDATNPFRNTRAHYFLPNVHEWYKAAYHDPRSDDYWVFPNGSNSPPQQICPGGESGPGTAVYLGCFAGPADVHEAGGLSPHGVMGLGGNVWEWEESSFASGNESGSTARGLRGGFWSSIQDSLSSSVRLSDLPSNQGNIGLGFRVASLPEPNSCVLIWWGMLLLGNAARRACSRAL